MAIDLKDLQIHVLTAHDPVAVIYAFFRIDNTDLFRAALGTEPLACMPESLGAATPARSANIGFTLGGLKKLGVDQRTLDTFPEPFREGMAKRAELIGDTGDIAPENWDGYLGSPDVH